MAPTELLRFMQKVQLTKAGCWLWTGNTRHNYGSWHQDGDSCWVHRLMYRHFVGPIPKYHVIDHMCENKGCCNPEHLKAVTLSANAQLWHWRRMDEYVLRLPFNGDGDE
jgi:hypothetical protein